MARHPYNMGATATLQRRHVHLSASGIARRKGVFQGSLCTKAASGCINRQSKENQGLEPISGPKGRGFESRHFDSRKLCKSKLPGFLYCGAVALFFQFATIQVAARQRGRRIIIWVCRFEDFDLIQFCHFSLNQTGKYRPQFPLNRVFVALQAINPGCGL